jgi:membrane protein
MWEKTKTTASNAFEILKAAGKEYGTDRVARMAAAVAYRAIFALAPLFLIAVFVFGLFLGDESARMEVLDSVEQFAGETVRQAMVDVLDNVADSSGSAGVIGFVLLLWTGSSLFMELQNDLNDIFHVPREHTTGPIAFIKKRGLGFLFSVGLGLLLVSVVLLNSIWQFLGGLFPENLEPVHDLITVLTPLVSLIVLPFVMALTFQVLSRVKVRWKAVWWGSFFTSVAFLAAAYGASLYFRVSGPTAAGVAGSIFVILLLAFILSAVYLFGAEVTKVYNDFLEKGDIRPPTHREGDEEPPEVIIHEPSQPLPLAALFAFLGGLFVGWRRDR